MSKSEVSAAKTVTVWKYAIPMKDRFSLALPVGAQVLSAQLQRDVPQMWVLVDPNAAPDELEQRQFLILGTGSVYCEPLGRFVDTFQTRGGLVFHLFEDTWSVQ